MRMLLVAGLALLAFSGPARAQAASCHAYEPAIVELTGRLSFEQLFGPPGYGENPESDAVETHPFLALDVPICVRAEADDKLNKHADKLAEVQLVDEARVLVPAMDGQELTVRGMLVSAYAEHQRTPAVLKTLAVTQPEPVPLAAPGVQP